MNLNRSKDEQNKNKLHRLAQEANNKFCFDCGLRGPMYVVIDFHILVCSICSSAHRSFQHKVKGISVSTFSEEEVVTMEVVGNGIAAESWLASFGSNKSRSGDFHAIRGFVEDVFVKELYLDKVKRDQIEKDIQSALSYQGKPSVVIEAAIATPLSRLRNEPCLQKSATIPKPEPLPPVVNSIQQKPPQSALDVLFSAPCETTCPSSAAARDNHLDKPSTTKFSSNLLHELFSAKQPTYGPSLTQQQSNLQSVPEQHHSSASNNGHPMDHIKGSVVYSPFRADVQESNFNSRLHCFSEVFTDLFPSLNDSKSMAAPLNTLFQPQIAAMPAPQQPPCAPPHDQFLNQDKPVDYFPATPPSFFDFNQPTGTRGTALQQAKPASTPMHSDDSVFASLNPFGNTSPFLY